MKKFFSTVVLAVAAIFGLSNCGGGGESSDVIDVTSFATGNKWFAFGGRGGQQTLFLTGSGEWEGKKDENQVVGVRFKSAVGSPSNNEKGYCDYRVERDDAGNIVSAVISMSYFNVQDNDVADYFGFIIDDDDENQQQGGQQGGGEEGEEGEEGGNPGFGKILNIKVDFATKSWEEVGNEQNNGYFWIHRQGT